MAEVDGVVDHQSAARRREARRLVAFAHRHPSAHEQIAAGGALLVDARFAYQRHERIRAAVGDGNLWALHLDAGVVDPATGQSGEYVLHRTDAGPAASQRRIQRGIDHELRERGDFHTFADEHDSAVHRRRGERQGDAGARVKPDARQCCALLQRPLAKGMEIHAWCVSSGVGAAAATAASQQQLCRGTPRSDEM